MENSIIDTKNATFEILQGNEIDTKSMSPLEVKNLILDTVGMEFEVTFVKRTNNTIRKMKAKIGDMRKNSEKSKQMEKNNLLPVMDVEDMNKWKSIPLDATISIKLAKKELPSEREQEKQNKENREIGDQVKDMGLS